LRFEFTAEESNFKRDLGTFLDNALPDDWQGPADESRDDHWDLNQKIKQGLADRGWLVMSWPKKIWWFGFITYDEHHIRRGNGVPKSTRTRSIWDSDVWTNSYAIWIRRSTR
jgi:hypothetical protein